MLKFRLMFDKNEEIPWLDQMAQQGWNLKRFALGLYQFEPCRPGEYVYETDLKDRLIAISPEYRTILKSQDIELIPSTSFWFLVRRKKALGPLELYTYLESRLEQYRRIRHLFKAVCLLELVVCLLELWAYTETGSSLLLVLAILLGVMGLTLLRQVTNVNQQIAQLEGHDLPFNRVQMLTASGMFMMSCGFLIRGFAPDWIDRIFMIAGFVLLLAGLFVQIRSKNRSAD